MQFTEIAAFCIVLVSLFYIYIIAIDLSFTLFFPIVYLFII